MQKMLQHIREEELGEKGESQVPPPSKGAGYPGYPGSSDNNEERRSGEQNRGGPSGLG